MIYEILEVFKKEYEEKGDKLVLGNYELKEGLYVKINNDERIEYFIVKKKNRELSFTDINGNLNFSAYEWFKERDYRSGVLGNRKVLDAPKKIIHNNNYLTLFMKADRFNSDNLQHIRNSLYLKLLSFNFNKQERKTIKDFNIENSFRRKRDIVEKFRKFMNSFDEILKKLIEYNVTNYIKIFFEEDIEKYKKESEIYFSIKLFNSISYCKTINGENYGLSNSNMGLNAKKPFLEHKTKINPVPYLIKYDDALDLKVFFDWLKIQPYKDKENKPIDRYLDDSFFMLKHSSNDEAEITDFDFVPIIEDKLKESILIKNYLWLREGKVTIEDFDIEKLSQLEVIVDDIFYNKQLINNYYGEVWKKLDNSFANFIYLTREAMIAYFRKYDEKGFYDVIKKYSTKLIIEHIKKDRMLKAGKALNFKLSLLANKGEKIMNIKHMQKKLNENLIMSNYDELTTEEFFYLCGQISKYIINQSETYEKKGDMLEPFMRSNNAKKLKNTVEQVYFKYKHKISLHFLKFNNAMSLIMAYTGEEKLNANIDAFLVGALSENIFYMKNEEAKGE